MGLVAIVTESLLRGTEGKMNFEATGIYCKERPWWRPGRWSRERSEREHPKCSKVRRKHQATPRDMGREPGYRRYVSPGMGSVERSEQPWTAIRPRRSPNAYEQRGRTSGNHPGSSPPWNRASCLLVLCRFRSVRRPEDESQTAALGGIWHAGLSTIPAPAVETHCRRSGFWWRREAMRGTGIPQLRDLS